MLVVGGWRGVLLKLNTGSQLIKTGIVIGIIVIAVLFTILVIRIHYKYKIADEFIGVFTKGFENEFPKISVRKGSEIYWMNLYRDESYGFIARSILD